MSSNTGNPPVPSIWSIKIKKKKKSPAESPDESSARLGRKRNHDSMIKSEQAEEGSEVKLESDGEEDVDLQDMFGIGKEAQATKEDIRILAERRAKRARATKVKDEDNSSGSRPRPRVRPAPALKSKLTRSEAIALETSAHKINTIIQKFSYGTQDQDDIKTLRDCVQSLPYIPADSVFVQSKGTLRALTTLSREGKELHIPDDIILDGKSLREKWLRSDFDKALMRGIASAMTLNRDQVRGKTKRSTHWKFEDGYKHKVNSLVPGHNGLSVGDWWPLQICAMRDGAHGETEAGISGNKEYGCLSVVVSNGYSRDEDHGDTVLYCGTLGITTKGAGDSVPSAGTKLLQTSMQNETPVRLLRSSKAKSKSPFAPSAGIRYDGLYLVSAYEVLDEKSQMYRFTMRRQHGQPAIRYQGPGARPNGYDLQEWNKIKHMMKGER